MSDKKLLIKLAADVEGLKKGLRKASHDVDTFTSQVQKMGGVMAAAFSVRAIGDFVLEISKLSGEAQGVKEAFDRLPNSVTVMQELKNATHGTVSELDLMKRAVMASNFDISLKALPQLLEFATLRAKQTGQSVNYLVDSIVTGIGRKSKLILDNLGISAVQLTEALGGASTAASSIGEVADAVGKIAEENLKKMGQLSENASTKLERLAASWENLKVWLGDSANSTGILSGLIDHLNDKIAVLTSNLPAIQKPLAMFSVGAGLAAFKSKALALEIEKLAEDQKLAASITRQAEQAIKTFGTNLEAIQKAYKQNINYQKIMNEVNRILIEDDKKKADSIRNEINLTAQLNSLREDASMAIGKERSELNKQIQAIEKEIEALQKLGVELNKINIYQERYDAWMRKIESKKATMDMADATHFAASGAPSPAQDAMGKAAEALKKRYEDIVKKNAELVDKMKQQAMEVAHTYAIVGDIIGQGFASAAIDAEKFARVMAKMASQVVAAIERVVLARMIEKSFMQGGPTPAAIAMAAAGFGIVKALFNRIGSDSDSGGGAFAPGGMFGRKGESKLQTKVSGRDLDIIYTTQRRYDTRTNTVNPAYG